MGVGFGEGCIIVAASYFEHCSGCSAACAHALTFSLRWHLDRLSWLSVYPSSDAVCLMDRNFAISTVGAYPVTLAYVARTKLTVA